jgi:choloylglycine hydrolase
MTRRSGQTNAPTYDWHTTNLQNYVNLGEGCATAPSSAGHASGLARPSPGMPGDFTSPRSWFARRSTACAPNATAEDAAPSTSESVRHPEGLGAELCTAARVTITEWTSVADPNSQYLTFTAGSIHMVDLKECRGRQGEVHPQDGGMTQPIIDASTNLWRGSRCRLNRRSG